MEILSSVALCAGGALAAARAGSRSNLSSSASTSTSNNNNNKPPRVVALGITNQRESTIAWDRTTGSPLHRSIVWNDGRTAEICARVEREHGGKVGLFFVCVCGAFGGPCLLALDFFSLLPTRKNSKEKKTFQDCFRAVTGLPVSPYFSAYKMLWLLENVPSVKKAAEEGKLAFGTVDSWLIFHLTGGSSGRGKNEASSSSPSSSPTFVTDVTNASRTGLMCLRTRTWHAGTCAKLGIEVEWLPRIVSSAETYGKVVAPLTSSENIAEMVRDKASLYRTCSGGEGFAASPSCSTSNSSDVVSWGCKALAGVPISGCLGDQQAALLGQRCRVGEAKATYGTGAFVLLVTGSSSGGESGEDGDEAGPVSSSSGLLTTAAYQLGPQAPLFYALEGAVAVAGAGVSWLRDGLGIIARPQEVEELARSAEGGSDGVVLVPAFAGLLAPRWRADARGVIVGLTSATTKAHLARAMLDAIGWQTKEVVEAMAKDRSEALTRGKARSSSPSGAAATAAETSASSSSSVAAISRLRVDGGASRNDLLMEIQANLLGLPVERPAHGETTSLGAALAAGIGAGVFSAEEAFTVGTGASPAVFLPKAKREDVAKAYEKWNDAVQRSYGLA